MSLAVPLTHLAELADAEQRLADHLDARDPDWAAQPSTLPGWSRAHVVAHLAGNAEGMANLVAWARSGDETPMYPSPEARSAEIDRRAKLPWRDLLEEQRGLAASLRRDLETLTEPVAERDLRLGSGAHTNVCDLAAVRVREIEIHRVDLSDDYAAACWRTSFTTRTLGQVAPFFAEHRSVPVRTLRAHDTGTCWEVGASGPELIGSQADLLAWLLGRPHGQLTSTAGANVPVAPAWV
jgi:maleylpyruvate isomerase